MQANRTKICLPHSFFLEKCGEMKSSAKFTSKIGEFFALIQAKIKYQAFVGVSSL